LDIQHDTEIAMPKRILFVDDEPSIRGIYELLESVLGDGYFVRTAPGGREALDILQEKPFDVVVSDLTMPRMSGIELLSEVSRRFPATARVVVSGFADEITAAKCLMVGHRYFTKPFDPMALSDVVVSLCNARRSAANEKIREYVGKIDAIPTLSKTYLELTKALRSNCLPLRDISAIIERDLALTAKVLQTVNSVRYAQNRKVQSVFEAVQLIGFEVVRALVLSIQVFEFCQQTIGTEFFNFIWSHSLATATATKRLCHRENLPPETCEEAFLLGLLHDIGKVVLAASCPNEYCTLWREHSGNSRGTVKAELDLFGADHAHVGAYLLRLWGIPELVVGGVEVHHSLDVVDISGFTPALALHVAQELAPGRPGDFLDLEVVRKLGFEDRIPAWRAVVERGVFQN
jgi:putative nucleotidyltransferase with HDIG domain